MNVELGTSNTLMGLAGGSNSGEHFAQLIDAGHMPVFKEHLSIEQDGRNGTDFVLQNIIHVGHLLHFRGKANTLQSRAQVMAQFPVLAVAQP